MNRSRKESWQRGPLAWMTYNRVTPNLLMIVLLLGGIFVSGQIKKEVFPAYELDMVTVSVAYPGASPEEVEHGIILVVEEAVRGLEGIKELTATAAERHADQSGSNCWLTPTSKRSTRISSRRSTESGPSRTMPRNPRFRWEPTAMKCLTSNFTPTPRKRRCARAAEQVRDRLLQDPGITQVDLSGARALEIHVDVPQDKLRAYDLTLDGIARIIEAASTEIPGGAVETSGGDILLRVTDRRDWAREFARIPIISTADGTVVLLEDHRHGA